MDIITLNLRMEEAMPKGIKMFMNVSMGNIRLYNHLNQKICNIIFNSFKWQTKYEIFK